MEPGYLTNILLQIPPCKTAYTNCERHLVLSNLEESNCNFLRSGFRGVVFHKSQLCSPKDLRKKVLFSKLEDIFLEYYECAKGEGLLMIGILREGFGGLERDETSWDTIKDLVNCEQSFCNHLQSMLGDKHNNFVFDPGKKE